MKQSETKKNIINILKQFSVETGIPLQFIEKDIYVLKVLSVLSKINYPDIKIVFTGGTCLSKAYEKIKRFSEDMDFCIHTNIPFSRKDKSNLRKFIISELNKSNDFKVIDNNIKITDESSFFSFEIEYDKDFEISSNLRKNIKIEFKFENLQMPSKNCELKTLVHQFINDETVNFDCINVLEVAANKYSALLWRTFIKDRTQPVNTPKNDPTIMRHLYDIAALENDIKNTEFIKLIKYSCNKDTGRGGVEHKYSIEEFSKIILDKLQSDKLFKEEYINFVDTMCYSRNKISFDDAIKSLKNIVDYITQSL